MVMRRFPVILCKIFESPSLVPLSHSRTSFFLPSRTRYRVSELTMPAYNVPGFQGSRMTLRAGSEAIPRRGLSWPLKRLYDTIVCRRAAHRGHPGSQ